RHRRPRAAGRRAARGRGPARPAGTRRRASRAAAVHRPTAVRHAQRRRRPRAGRAARRRPGGGAGALPPGGDHLSDRPAPPPGARNLVMVILDSLRYDSWVEAQPPVLGTLGTVERRFSYASWTAPSHYNLLMGLLPHSSPPEVYASEYYKEDFRRYGERLNVGDMGFKRLLPSIFLPTFLRNV